MSFRVGEFKNGWTLYRQHSRYYPPEIKTSGLQIYEIYKDILSLDYTYDQKNGERTEKHILPQKVLYSAVIKIDISIKTDTRMPVLFGAGKNIDILLEEERERLRTDPQIEIPTPKNGILIGFATYEDLVRNYTTLDQFIEWKKYEAAKKRYDHTGHQDFSVNGETLLFPSERDIRKRILEEEEELRDAKHNA